MNINEKSKKDYLCGGEMVPLSGIDAAANAAVLIFKRKIGRAVVPIAIGSGGFKSGIRRMTDKEKWQSGRMRRS